MPGNDIMEYLSSQSHIFNKEIEKTIPRNREPFEVYGLIWEFLDRGGKRFRPAMVKLSYEAVGGDPKTENDFVIPIGAGIEMFHNFTLLHDDIEDDSDMRRGKPTIHKMYGIPLAINAGDGLFMMVWEALLKSKLPSEKLLEAQHVLSTAFRHVLEGQAIELNWYRENRFDVDEELYSRMTRGKTGALISASCEVGAMMGNAKPDQRKALADFGMAVGVAFQIQDDVLNLAGSEEKYGKEIGGDISEGKRSLITIHALSHANAKDKKALTDILASKTKDKEKVRQAIEICKRNGSIDYASSKAKSIVEEAKQKIMVLPNNEASRRLLQLADFFIYREL